MQNRYIAFLALVVTFLASQSAFSQDNCCCYDAAGGSCPGFECVVNTTGDCATSCGVTSNFVCNAGNGAQEATCPTDATCTSLPVELVSLTAISEGQAVFLQWNTASETDNVGFEVQRATGPGTFEEIAFIDGAGTTLEPKAYSYRVEDLDPGTHTFRLKQLDFDGTFAYSGLVEAAVTLPTKYVLDAAYPNPFNPSTSVRYAVDAEQVVRMELFDAYGQSVRTVFEGNVEANAYQTVQVHGHGLATGIYMLRLLGEQFVATQKLVLVK